LTKEIASVEEKYNRQIDSIRPNVAEKKEKYERERLQQHRQIEARFAGRLHDLRNKRDAAVAKIRAYDPDSGNRSEHAIERQYSIKKSAEQRIKELEEEQENQIDTVDEKYDAACETIPALIKGKTGCSTSSIL